MKWTKKGLVYAPDGSHPWMRHAALQPTPLLLRDAVVQCCGNTYLFSNGNN
jgi:hypothetical protein